MLTTLTTHLHHRHRRLTVAALVMATVAALVVLDGWAATVATGVAVVVLGWAVLGPTTSITLTGEELDRLRQAELALAGAADVDEAARDLADHALALLGARSAVVLIETIGGTVRAAAGPTTTEDVYGSGSRMRLLDDAGVPCGSIAVSARADGREYLPREERILDALAERVSTTIHQLSLLAAVRAERRTLTDLVSASSDGIFAVGSDLRVQAWNPAIARITGVPAEQAIGDHISLAFRPVSEDGRNLFGANDPGRTGLAVDAVPVRVAVKDEERFLTCSYSPLPDGGYVVVARDETDRRKLQDDKDGWIAQVSHELRTPLTPIKGFLQTLARRDDELESADRRRIYEVMLREEERLEALVDDLLRATQLDHAGLMLVPEVLDWVETVQREADAFRRHDPTRPIAVQVVGDVARVVADEALAGGVIANLLSNAAKYSPPGSDVTLRVERRDDVVVTSVVDHGPGVPASDCERIFDKFTRLGDHLTRAQPGVGLGLYIARTSIRRLDGSIWVDATPGGGATFRFTLPVAAHRADTATSKRRHPLSAGPQQQGRASAPWRA